jgi:hypothetical protein
LAIYLSIIISGFLKSSRLLRATKNNPEQRWIYDLAMMIQMSLLVFCVGAAALSMAYYDVFMLLLSMLMPLTELVFPAVVRKVSTFGTERVELEQSALPSDRA